MADVNEATNFEDSGQAISLGRRHLLVRDYVNAVTALAQGCAMLANQHGEMADELGEPFLLYGRALLCLSREEAGVLGTGVPGNDEDKGDGEAEEGSEEQGEEEDGNEEKSNEDKKEEKKDEGNQKNGSEKSRISSEDSSKKSKEDEGPSTSSAHQNGGVASTSTAHQNGEASENGEDNDDEDVEDEEDDDDASSNLQLAWEVLELAKLILLKRGPPGWKLLAETHRLLGEVAMESGNQPGALTDLSACLDLLGKIEPADARSIAETHYQLGLAYSLGNEFDESIKEFQEASNLLETRVKELESTTEPANSEDPFYTVAGEIKELKELLPEIHDKIADMRDFKQQACKLVIEGIKSHVAGGSCSNGAGPSGEGSSSSSSGAGPSSSKPVSDITHLVRKKRKPEDEDENPIPAKKISPEKSG